MLFVPREPFAVALPGLAPARAVPSDLVIAAASRLLPADILQKLVLLAIFVLACSGAAALLDREPLLARLAAGVFYTWNPYVAERLIIGQWALLLGYAGLPWVLRAVLTLDPSPGPTPDAASHTTPDPPPWHGVTRLALALLPATVGGFAAMTVTALLALPVALLTKSLRRVVVTLVALTIGSLPWLIPSLLHPVYVDPASVAAFAARADTPFGSIGSLFMLGGAWNAQTVPQAYGGPWSALWLAAVLIALTAYLVFALRERRWPGLGPAAAAGLLIAALGLTAFGRDLLRSLIAAWPAFAILRDAQQFVAPLALAESVGFALAVSAALTPRPLARTAPKHSALSPSPNSQGGIDADGITPTDRQTRTDADRPTRTDAAGIVLAVFALLAPVLLLPGLAWGAAGRLRPTWYPTAWLAAARTLDASAAPGSVLLLPWATYRTPPWNHGETLIDPWTHLLSRPVIWNDGTQVGDVPLAPDDPQARALAHAIDGGGPLTATLRAAGVRYVVDDADAPGSQLAARLPGSVVIIKLPSLTVYQIPT